MANGTQIMLAVKVFDLKDGEFVLRTEPKLITADNHMAEIRSTLESGDEVSILLTPSIQ
jgi:hypothetical protein